MAEDQDEIQDTLYSLSFQRKILRMLASNVKFAQMYGIYLKDEYFESQPMRLAFEIIRDQVFKFDREVDMAVVRARVDDLASARGYAEEVVGEIHNCFRLINKAAIINERALTDQLLKFVRKKELQTALLKGADILDQDGDYEEVLKLVDTAVGVGTGSDEGLNFRDLKLLPRKYIKVYDPKKLIKTGFDTYDQCLNGGMAPRESHYVVAPPKVGKSSFGVCVGAHNVKSSKCVYHISGEISKEALGMKYATNITGVPERELIHKEARKMYERKIERWQSSNPRLFINHWPEGSANILQVRAWCVRKRAQTGESPDLIIVDYDDCFNPVGGKTESMYEDSGGVAADLLLLADYFNCPVLTFSQPKPEVWEWPNEGKLITHRYLAHSSRKSHRAYSIASLNFPEDSETGILFMDITRRGEGKTKIPIQKDLTRCRMWQRDKR